MLRFSAKQAFSNTLTPFLLGGQSTRFFRPTCRFCGEVVRPTRRGFKKDAIRSRPLLSAPHSIRTRAMSTEHEVSRSEPVIDIGLARELLASETRLAEEPRDDADLLIQIHDRINSEYKGEPRRNIYIVGRGNIGKLLGFSLTKVQNPPGVLFLIDKKHVYDDWLSKESKIKANFSGIERNVARVGLEYLDAEAGIDARLANEAVYRNDTELGIDTEVADPQIIKHLIICVKAQEVTKWLKQIQHRLDATSTILFVQNGMGFIDEVNEEVFPDPQTRPTYAVGIVTHGVRNLRNRYVKEGERDMGSNRYTIYIARGGDIKMAYLPREDGVEPTPTMGWAFEKTYLLRALERSVNLRAQVEPLDALVITRYQKLAGNAVINALTALLGCSNGALLGQHHITPAIRSLISETSSVMLALPELQEVEDKESIFSKEALEVYIVDLISRTRVNTSSMLQDISDARNTEIAYINGYISKKGAELGIATPQNDLLVSLIQTKERLTIAEFRSKMRRDSADGSSGSSNRSTSEDEDLED